MSNRIRLTATVVTAGIGVLAGMIAGLSSPANAEDQRPCVSRVEFLGNPPDTGITRPELEARWDVSGLGYIDREFSTDAENLWVYPACDITGGEVWAFIRRSDHTYTGGYWYRPSAW